MLSKLIIIGFVLAIVYTLGSSFYFLVSDKGVGERTVRRLTWRVCLSLLLVCGLALAFQLGWIEPQGIDPVQYPPIREPGGA